MTRGDLKQHLRNDASEDDLSLIKVSEGGVKKDIRRIKKSIELLEMVTEKEETMCKASREEIHENVNAMQSQINALQHAFTTLSDTVVDEIDTVRRDMKTELNAIASKADRNARAIHQLKSEVLRFATQVDHNSEKFRDSVAMSQASISKLEVRTEEVRIDIAGFRANWETFSSHNREIIRKQEHSESAQNHLMEWMTQIRNEHIQIRNELHNMKEEHRTGTLSLASDAEALAGNASRMQLSINKQTSYLKEQLEELRARVTQQSALVRECEREFPQKTKQLEDLTENLLEGSQHSRIAFLSLQQEHAEIRAELKNELQAYKTELSNIRRELEQRDTILNHQHQVEQQEQALRSEHIASKHQAIVKAVKALAQILNVASSIDNLG